MLHPLTKVPTTPAELQYEISRLLERIARRNDDPSTIQMLRKRVQVLDSARLAELARLEMERIG